LYKVEIELFVDQTKTICVEQKTNTIGVGRIINKEQDSILFALSFLFRPFVVRRDHTHFYVFPLFSRFFFHLLSNSRKLKWRGAGCPHEDE
jgi:hypothetical protein